MPGGFANALKGDPRPQVPSRLCVLSTWNSAVTPATELYPATIKAKLWVSGERAVTVRDHHGIAIALPKQPWPGRRLSQTREHHKSVPKGNQQTRPGGIREHLKAYPSPSQAGFANTLKRAHGPCQRARKRHEKHPASQGRKFLFKSLIANQPNLRSRRPGAPGWFCLAPVHGRLANTLKLARQHPKPCPTGSLDIARRLHERLKP